MERSHTFATLMVDFSNKIVYYIITYLCKNNISYLKWLYSDIGISTRRVFIRKYLLRYWEFYNDNGDSVIGKRFDNLKQYGSFLHSECLFDFIFMVVCEHVKHVCYQMCKKYQKSENLDIPLQETITKITPRLRHVLTLCKHGCASGSCTIIDTY